MSFLILLLLISVSFGRLEIKNLETEHIPDQYVIVYHTNTTSAQAIKDWDVMASYGVEFLYKYNAGSFKGFAATIVDEKILSAIQDDPLVMSIEVNSIVRINDCPNKVTQTGVTTWGIARVGQVQPTPGSGPYTYNYNGTGSNVNIYIIDTGIRITHDEFVVSPGIRRAEWGANFISGSTDTDDNGHGTHCAGTAAGKTYGVAKDANVYAVKVLDGSGSGTIGGIVAGIEWVINHNVEKRKVISMSLGAFGSNSAMTTAVNAAVNNGIPCVVAAGNSGSNACSYTPAGIPDAITVAATGINDAMASFSNFGSCVDLFAPGVNIISAWIDSDTAFMTLSGTSMSTPHVAGQAAVIFSQFPGYNADNVKSKLVASAQPKVTGGKSSPNLLLYNGCTTSSE
jgi:subtilisin family serine protease